MKKAFFGSLFFLLGICLAIVGCSSSAEFKSEDIARFEKNNPIGKEILVNSDLIDKGVEISASIMKFDYKNGNYFVNLIVDNQSNQPINLTSDKIILVDTAGEEYKSGLVGADLVKPIHPGAFVQEVVGFEYKNGKNIPSFIKVKV